VHFSLVLIVFSEYTKVPPSLIEQHADRGNRGDFALKTHSFQLMLILEIYVSPTQGQVNGILLRIHDGRK
jgi:hypothetical protein